MKNPITLTNITTQRKEIKTIFELGEKELKDFKFLGQGYGINVGHVLFTGTRHNQNLWLNVVAYQIVESKYTEWIEKGIARIGRHEKYISVKFFGLNQ